VENQALADELDNLDLDTIFPGFAEVIAKGLAQFRAIKHPSSSMRQAELFSIPSEIPAHANFECLQRA